MVFFELLFFVINNLELGKSQAIYFTCRQSSRHLPQTQVSWNGVDIPWSETVDYLGVSLDQKLNFGCHVTNSIRKCDILTKPIYPLVKRRSRLHLSILLLYKTVFRPTVTYGFPAWFEFLQSCSSVNPLLQELVV